MVTETITVEKRGASFWIRLNRPASLNSLSPAMAAEIDHALDFAESDKSTRTVVFTANGRAFCAGADLKEALAMAADGSGDEATLSFLHSVTRLIDRIEHFRLPVVAAVNGLAIAGGLELVLACDLVVAAKSARLGDGHAKFGLLPGGGGSVRLPRKIGVMRAKYLMFTGEYLTADELAAWGLVTFVVPDEELESFVETLVTKLAEKSPLGLARMKQLVDSSIDQPAALALQAEQLMNSLHIHAEDRAEGLLAFSEKRGPRFTGR